MFRPTFLSGRNAPSAPRLVVDDLNAQLAPLDLYGLTGMSAAVVDGLLALAGGRAASDKDHALRAGS
ncbi:MAG: hypothetical protein WBQ45_17190 [Roseiarcus sp.]|uniref:hypothetical protein n=1 Tax=Roseiarcus sp. TaxID=1969460 RepID=UPI003C38D940